MLNPIDTSGSSNSNNGGNAPNPGGNAPNPGGNNPIIGNTEQDHNSNFGSNDNYVGNNDLRANVQQYTDPTEGNDSRKRLKNRTLKAPNRTKSGISRVHPYQSTTFNHTFVNTPVSPALRNSNSAFTNTPVRDTLRNSNSSFANTPVRETLRNSNSTLAGNTPSAFNSTFTVSTPTETIVPNYYNYYNPLVTPLKSELNANKEGID